jgi:hypothetical protein
MGLTDPNDRLNKAGIELIAVSCELDADKIAGEKHLG